MKTIFRLFVCLSFLVVYTCDKDEVRSEEDTISESDLLLERDKEDIGACETAFAYDSESICFSDDDEYLNTNRWGWSLGPLSEGFNGSFDIYSGAGQCNLNNGELVGTLEVNYSGGTVTVDYVANDGFAFFETHLYVGNEKYPTKRNGRYTVAPGQYGNSNSYNLGVSVDSFTIDNLSGDIYIIAHAVVCEVKDEECIADAGVIKADSISYCLDDKDEAIISATPDGGLVVPEGYNVLYVLTTGPELVILAVSETPSFLVTEAGDYTIHTLVYDQETLDLSIVQFGTTTGFDVLAIIEANGICASLDAVGAPIKVDKCDATGAN